MFNAPEIKLLQGFCSLNFGASQEDAILVFGEPDEIQKINDDILNNSSLVAHYWDLGFSLFFDNHFNKRFCSVEIDNKESLLYDCKLFALKEKELIQLLLQNGHALSDKENHPWGEKRVSFDSISLDCYFEHNKLVSVNFGVLDSGTYFNYFPN